MVVVVAVAVAVGVAGAFVVAVEVAAGAFAVLLLCSMQLCSSQQLRAVPWQVIANRAIEMLGGEMGSKIVHPNDHVNKS